MRNYAHILKENGVEPSTFLEIGSRDGHCCATFCSAWGPKPITPYVIEPSPHSFSNIKQDYPEFHVFNCAFSDYCGVSKFNNVKTGTVERGMSSLLDRDVYSELDTEVIEVEVIKGKDFLDQQSINQIDACKIDVEGNTYQVLKGFEDDILKVRSFHVEAELVEVWDGQTVYQDIHDLLSSFGYSRHYYTEYNHPTTQCDTIWIHY